MNALTSCRQPGHLICGRLPGCRVYHSITKEEEEERIIYEQRDEQVGTVAAAMQWCHRCCSFPTQSQFLENHVNLKLTPRRMLSVFLSPYVGCIQKCYFINEFVKGRESVLKQNIIMTFCF